MGFNPLSVFSVFLLLFIFFFHVNTALDAVAERVCEDSAMPEVCKGCIGAYDPGNNARYDALAIHICCQNRRKTAVRALEKTIAETKNPALISVCNSCLQTFKLVYEDVDNANRAFNNNDYKAFKNHLQKGYDDVVACLNTITQRNHKDYWFPVWNDIAELGGLFDAGVRFAEEIP